MICTFVPISRHGVNLEKMKRKTFNEKKIEKNIFQADNLSGWIKNDLNKHRQAASDTTLPPYDWPIMHFVFLQVYTPVNPTLLHCHWLAINSFVRLLGINVYKIKNSSCFGIIFSLSCHWAYNVFSQGTALPLECACHLGYWQLSVDRSLPHR